MNKKAILFDLDDTLLHSVHIKWAQHQEVARRFYKIELDESTLRQHWGKPSVELVQEFYQNAEEVEVMLEKFHSLDDQFLKTLVPDASHVLHYLASHGTLIGIVTNARKKTVDDDMHRLESPFQDVHFIHTYEDTRRYKPDPAAFDQAIALLHERNIKDVTYVGDSLIDLRAAKGASLDFIGITTGITTNDEFINAGATKVISNLKQLLPMYGEIAATDTT